MNLEQYTAALQGPVWRDMSHFGQFLVSGADAAKLLHHLTTNEINRLQPGEARETVLISARARVLDFLTVICLVKHQYLVITSPNRREMFPGHARHFILFRQDVSIEDVTGRGPLTGIFDLSGYGSDPWNGTVESWATRRLPGQGLIGRAAPPEGMVNLADNATYNVLRVEAGIPVAGLELTEAINPWEAALHPFIALDKGCYNGQEIIARLNTYQKVKQSLVGLRFSAEVTPAMGQKLYLAEKAVGNITSVASSPRFGPVGLAYVRNAALESRATLALAGGSVSATVSDLPFVVPAAASEAAPLP